MSISGGLYKAVERAMHVDATALQIFTRNQRQWKFPPITEKDAEAWFAARADWGDYPVAAHDSYLINLANPDPEKAERAVQGFAEELRRCDRLDVPWLVTHPGSHLGQGVAAGITGYVKNLDRSLEMSGTSAMVLLETTAGQGTNLGSTFEQLATMISTSHHPDRLGVCLDTCHVFAAGYDLRTDEGYAITFERFDSLVGLERLKLFHLNDSKNPAGSKKDRHTHIGEGDLGMTPFVRLMNDPRFTDTPMILETPKDDDPADDVRNLTVLRNMRNNS